jgi:hypothetical protein
MGTGENFLQKVKRMTEHNCQKERTFVAIETDVVEVRNAFREMLTEFKELTRDLRNSLIDGRERKIEASNLRRDVDKVMLNNDRFWKELDKIRNIDIAPLRSFKERTEGTYGAFKIIPIVCTIIVALMTIYNYSQAPQEKMSYQYLQPPQEVTHPPLRTLQP